MYYRLHKWVDRVLFDLGIVCYFDSANIVSCTSFSPTFQDTCGSPNTLIYQPRRGRINKVLRGQDTSFECLNCMLDFLVMVKKLLWLWELLRAAACMMLCVPSAPPNVHRAEDQRHIPSFRSTAGRTRPLSRSPSSNWFLPSYDTLLRYPRKGCPSLLRSITSALARGQQVHPPACPRHYLHRLFPLKQIGV